MKSTTKKLILLFFIIFGIKSIISFFYTGTFFFSDEACVVEKAKYFAEHFRIVHCSLAAKAPAGNPMPFYSILLSPIYLFTKGITAYHLVTILNSLLISSLVFPLFSIIKKFLKNKKHIFIIIFTILFLPQIVVFEKMLLTESIFVVINIWFLYFYSNYLSLKKQKTKNLILSIIFGIFAVFTRPFGFIVLFSMTVNELITTKNKKKAALLLIPISTISILIIFTIFPGLFPSLVNKLKSLTDIQYVFSLLKAIKNQYNSLLITTLFAPILIFFSYFSEKTPTFLKKIRFFILTFIILNFIVSANHMHDYLLKNPDNITDLLTRYINMSIIYLYLFSFIFAFRYKKFQLSILNISIIGISLLSIATLEYQNIKHSLNLDISIFYDTQNFENSNIIQNNTILKYSLLPVIGVLFALLLVNKKKTLIALLIPIILIQSAMLYNWEKGFIDYEQSKDPVFQEFKNTELNLLILQNYSSKIVSYSYWSTKINTNNNIRVMYLNTNKKTLPLPDIYKNSNKEKLKDYDFIITQTYLNLPVFKTLENNTIIYYTPKGKNKEEQEKSLKITQ